MDILGGEALIRRREAAGYTREEFVALLGMSVRTLEDWEAKAGQVPARKRSVVEKILDRPKTELPTLDLLAQLAARLSVGEAASKRLAELERDHPELFRADQVDSSIAGKNPTSDPRVDGTSSGDDVARGRRRAAPRRRIRDQEHDDET